MSVALAVVASALVGVLAVLSPVLLLGLVALAVLVWTRADPLRLAGVLVVVLAANGLVSQLLVSSGGLARLFGGVKDVLLLVLLVVVLLRRRYAAVPPAVLVLVVAVLAIAALGAFRSASLAGAAYGFRNDYQPLLLLLVAPAAFRDVDRRRLYLLLAGVTQVIGAVALATWALRVRWVSFLQIFVPGRDSIYPASYFKNGSGAPRAFSPYTAPNELAVACLIGGVVILFLPGISRLRRGLLLLLPAAALLVSGSRSGLLGLGVLLAVCLTHRAYERGRSPGRGIAIAAIISTIGINLYLGIARPDLSLQGHAVSLRAGFHSALEHPAGFGLGSVGPRAGRFTPNAVQVESFVLLVALEAGIAAVLAYVALLVSLARELIRRVPDGVVGLAALGATLPAQLVLPVLQEGAVSYLLWLVVGVSLVPAREKDSELAEART